MLAYTRLHALALVLLLGLGLVGCASAKGPRIHVLGVESARSSASSLLVVVEVVNPGPQAIELSRLEYSMSAESWFRGRGQVRVERAVAPGSAAVVEIAVPVRGQLGKADGAIDFHLAGRLFAIEERRERSWDVDVKGTLGTHAALAGGPIRVTIAD